MKKLFLLDAYSIIFRSYYAFISHPVRNSKGMNTSAIFGFTNSLYEILTKEKPTHIAVAFDPPTPTFRNEIYAEYKANRLETPEDIKISVPYIKEIIDAFGIKIFEIPGYEADDVIGTIAKKAEKESFTVYLMTPDKDYLQLISEKIFVYKPRRSGSDVDIIGLEELKKEYEIQNPMQIIDVLTLWGDSTDNIPGVPGIGEKTARQLISRYGSIDNLLNNIEELKGKQKENILSSKPLLEISKKLVTINTEVPIDINFDELKPREWNREKLMNIFNELEFKSLKERILNQQETIFDQLSNFREEANQVIVITQKKQNIKTIEHNYKVLTNKEEIKSLVETLLKQQYFSFDTETTGLDPLNADIVGLSICYKEHEAYYIPFTECVEDCRKILENFKNVFENENILKIGQNIKYDIHILKNYGIDVKGPIFDTMIAHYLIQPELQHNMDYLAAKYLNYEPVSIESLIGKKGKNQLSMRQVPLEIIKEYACEDADITFQLYFPLNEELKKYGMENLAYNLEMPLVLVLVDMERAGFKLSTENLKTFGDELNKEILLLEEEIFSLAGERFNISSPKQLGEILFEKLKITVEVKKTKTDQYSTSEETLQQLVDKHPIISKILEYRTLKKLLNTYVEALPELINPKTGKVHTSFEQAWVATGRLSSKNPNLQNIPIRDEKGREIRKAFVASDDEHILLSADYSQIELRIMAHLSEDPQMIEAFLSGEDIHAATASKIFKVPIDKVDEDMRRKAKTANFGIIYGISAFGLSQRLSIPRSEAKQIIDEYFATYPRVKEYMNKVIEQAKNHGYVETIMGRRRYLPDIHSANAVVRGYAERNAINSPIQGSAADIIKTAMLKIHEYLCNNHLKTKMILQVHDELIFDVYKPELEEIKKIVKEFMESAFILKVPLIVDIGIGKNWLEAH